MFRSILVPVDGSSFSERALPYALGLGEQLGVPVHIALVHVPDTYYNTAETMLPHAEDIEREIKAKEREYLNDLKQRVQSASKARVEIHHLEGVIEETLEEEVAERNIGLVVLSTHGRGQMSRAILGSVTVHLVRHLSIPLLLVPPLDALPDLNPRPLFRSILIPLNGSELAQKIIGPAAAIGQPGKTQMQLLRVVPPAFHMVGPFTQRTATADQELLACRKAEAEAYLKKVAEGLRSQSYTVQTQVAASAHPAAAILDEAREWACDLIAIATRGRSGLMKLLVGSVTDKILRSASCPVLVYHPS